MPIALITGTPGSGKTYFAVSKAVELFPLEVNGVARPIYHDGINGLQLPWATCDAREWEKLPDGSIVIIDEAQRIFPQCPVGSKRPAHYSALNTHRHRGFDFVLTTQRSGLIDSQVRVLCQPHIHITRPFGFRRSNIYQWEEVKEKIDYHAKKEAVKSSQTFDPKVYGLYKSTTVDTVKRRVPSKLYLFAAMVVLMFGAIGFLVWKFNDMRSGDAASRALGKETASQKSAVGAPTSSADKPRPIDAVAWVETHRPRVGDLDYSAPRYDGLTTVKAVPVVKGCMKFLLHIPATCRCVTQQGTRANVSNEFCERWMEGDRPFLDFEGEAGSTRVGQPHEAAPTVAGAPVPGLKLPGTQ